MAREQTRMKSEEGMSAVPSLPLLIDNAKTATKLMEEGIRLQEQIDSDFRRLEEIKQELLEIQVAHDAPGFRFGNIVFIASFVKGRRMLNLELLVENGCPPEIIQKSYKEGEASWRRQLKRVL